MIDAFDARAAEAGVKVVQVCGFEALPPDLAVLLAAETARERWGEGLAEADLEVSVEGPPGMPRPSDMISGGTLQSLAAAAGGEDAAAVTDPAALITDPALAEEVRRRSPITVAPRRGADGAVIAPMAPAAFINPAVIQRTAALSRRRGGRPAVPLPRGNRRCAAAAATLPLRYAAAGVLSGTQAAVLAAARARPSVRRRVGGALEQDPPRLGVRPGRRSPRGLEAGTCRSTRARPAGATVRVDVDADGHPGYLATARMLGEAGLLLAEPGRHARTRRLPDAGDRDRHRVGWIASTAREVGSPEPNSPSRRVGPGIPAETDPTRGAARSWQHATAAPSGAGTSRAAGET